MKRCSTCNRTYTDPNLRFCIEDGTPLTEERAEDEVAYRPPAQYTPPGTVPGAKRRVWPWVAGLLGAFLLGAIGLTIALVIVAPRFAKQETATDKTDNTDKSVETEDPNAQPPTDQQQVLAQLRDLENEWTVANLNADKRKLDRILADDYVGQSSDRKLQGKVEYIRDIERDTQVDKWQFDDLKLDLAGDRATLTGKVTIFRNDQQEVLDFRDKFVWRNGRWQATGSEVSRKV